MLRGALHLLEALRQCVDPLSLPCHKFGVLGQEGFHPPRHLFVSMALSLALKVVHCVIHCLPISLFSISVPMFDSCSNELYSGVPIGLVSNPSVPVVSNERSRSVF
ncbi:hypothetical protein [Escherichia coli]|uniref:hypothetical protein n=1 Tax=Escherichia coli TaxID=562 RepID=UPI0024A9626C|nr:hypothetical protein [Escherichia coli]